MAQPADHNPTDMDAARETFREFLGRKGLRVTNQRMAIFEAAYRNPQHFTAEELLDQARAIDRSVSRATVYRTLPILTESNLVREIDVGKDYKFYLASQGKQVERAQVVDLENDKIYEIDAPFLEWYARSIAEKVGLEAVSSRLQVQARPIRPNPAPKE
ncbi:MAG: Fur family transcriptional regulator [Verrucomicrobiota bacterium JB022]|nr:Fur family transcriptional regulator [Verrucomicrobiota bacterium JB022]